jgi:hypothetical protein
VAGNVLKIPNEWATLTYTDVQFVKAEVDRVWPPEKPAPSQATSGSTTFAGISMPQQASPEEALAVVMSHVRAEQERLTSADPVQHDGGGDFGYSYRKAVLQAVVKMQRGTLERRGDRPHLLTIVLGVENKHNKLLTDCSAVVTAITGPNGKIVDVNKPLAAGENFAVDTRQPKQMALLMRDISDKVTPAPFLLRTAGPGIPLKENSRYLVALELRSRYPHPTNVIVQIDTETGLNATCAIIHQDVDRTGEE